MDVWETSEFSDFHICGSLAWFVDFIPVQQVGAFYEHVKQQEMMGYGKVLFEAKQSILGNWKHITIENVQYVPTSRNVLSEKLLKLQGYSVFKNTIGAIWKDETKKLKMIGIVNNKTNNTIIKIRPAALRKKKKVLTENVLQPNDANLLYHLRFAHMTHRPLQAANRGISGMTCSNVHQDMACLHCQDKSQRYKHLSSIKAQQNPFVLRGARINAYIIKWDVQSLTGNRYMITFRDVCTGFLWAYAIPHYYNAVGIIKEFLSTMEKRTKTAVKIFDFQHNFEGAALEEYERFISQKGIGNSRGSESFNPMEMADINLKSLELQAKVTCAAIASNLPERLWDEILDTITFLENCLVVYPSCPTTVFEDFAYRKPSASKLRVLGSLSVAIPLKKSKPKSCVFIGYCELKQSYKFFLKSQQRVVYSNQFVILEEDMLLCNVTKVDEIYSTVPLAGEQLDAPPSYQQLKYRENYIEGQYTNTIRELECMNKQLMTTINRQVANARQLETTVTLRDLKIQQLTNCYKKLYQEYFQLQEKAYVIDPSYWHC